MKQFLDDLYDTKICGEEIENLVMIPLKNYWFQAKSSYKTQRERRGKFFLSIAYGKFMYHRRPFSHGVLHCGNFFKHIT